MKGATVQGAGSEVLVTRAGAAVTAAWCSDRRAKDSLASRRRRRGGC